MIQLFFQIISLFCVALGQPAFFPWLGPFAASIGLALLWKSLEGYSLKKIGKVAFLWFFFVELIQLSWMTHLEYQGIYILLLYVLLSAGLAWQFSFLTRLSYKIPCLNGVFMVFIAALWTLLEWSRLHVLCGFAFNFLGLSLSCYTLPLQMASLFGVFGMSFWVVLTNLAAWRFFRTPSFSLAIKWVVLALIPYFYGFFHITYHEYNGFQKEQKNCRALLVQTALTPPQKYYMKKRAQDFLPPIEQWKRIFKSILEQKELLIDLIVMPEAVVPFGLDLYVYTFEEINKLCFSCFGKEIEFCFPFVKSPFGFRDRVSNAYILQTLANFFRVPVLAGLDYQEKNGVFIIRLFILSQDFLSLKDMTNRFFFR